ncbi:heme-binding protein [Nibricoccus sp. IMCC34717]|uniref:heme-binding protein n=1 Tax=Nibricoccus sp. IMCC34717 TaxID=3034021 RepID=UPI003851237C
MRKSLPFLFRQLLVFLLPMSLAMAAGEAFSPAPVGKPEVATLPAGLLLRSGGEGPYFDKANERFMPLFRYISKHDIRMTTPVEGHVGESAMYFWVAEDERHKAAAADGGVDVVKVGERLVARLGARGGYSETNYNETRDALLAWLATQPGYRASGEPYGVFWSGPFTPSFLKRYEVHQVLERIEVGNK